MTQPELTEQCLCLKVSRHFEIGKNSWF